MSSPKYPPILEAKRLSKKRSTAIGSLSPPLSTPYLFRDFSLDLSPGDLIFLLGKSGSGKSQLLRSLALLCPLDEGRILYRQREVHPSNVPNFRADVQYVSQFNSLSEGSVTSYLERIRSLKVHKKRCPQPGPSLLANIGNFLDAFHLNEDFLEKKTTHLSGGEGQLVNLLRILLLCPSVILLDEPTSAMDRQTKAIAEKMLVSHIREHSGAALWVTHDEEQAKRFGEKILHIEKYQT